MYSGKIKQDLQQVFTIQVVHDIYNYKHEHVVWDRFGGHGTFGSLKRNRIVASFLIVYLWK